MIPGGAGTPVCLGKGAPGPGARGPMSSYSERGPQRGLHMQTFPLRPFLLFLPAAIHPSFLLASLLAVTPCHCPVCPSVLPSSHPAIRLSIQPSFVLPFLAAPAFPLVSFAAVSHPGPLSRGLHPGAVRPPQSLRLPALLSDRPSLGILPESLSRESFQSIVPGNCSRTACLPQSFSPPATRLPSVLPSCGTVAQLSVDKAQGAFLPLAEGKASFLLQSHLF